jgi:hypothetical protein
MENDWRDLVRKNNFMAIVQEKVTKQMSKDEIERLTQEPNGKTSRLIPR